MPTNAENDTGGQVVASSNSVSPTMKGSPPPRFASDTATGAPVRARFAEVKALASVALLKFVDLSWRAG
jgi:hypothetical protein